MKRLQQLEKRIPGADFDKLEKCKIEKANVRRSGQARSTHGQANEAWALYKSNPSQGFRAEKRKEHA